MASDSSEPNSNPPQMTKGVESYLNLLNAEDKHIRRNMLVTILSEAKALSKDMVNSWSQSGINLDRDSDDEEEEDMTISARNQKEIQSSKAEGDIGDTKQTQTETNWTLEETTLLVKPLLNRLFDTVEKCRELSYETLNIIFQRIPKQAIIQFLPQTIPVLLERLGQQELIESSEEVRLLALGFMKTIVFRVGKDLAPFVDDWIRILSVTLTDPYHEVRKVTCEVINKSSEVIPHVFHYNSERLNKPLCLSITHQQSKVRIAIVNCIGNVLLNGNHKCADDFIPHLTQRLFDSQPNVRKAVVSVVGSWMMNYVDRYSYFHKFLPIIMTGLCDECDDVKELAYKLWEKVGERYLEENTQEYKDQVDFPAQMPQHYPDNVKRPNFGCRLLTQRNVIKIIPGVTNDITDWVETTRLKCAQLLFHLILNCEENITMHVEAILQCLIKSCLDPNPIVVKYVLLSAKLIGYFVPMNITWTILSSRLSANPSESCLAVTASVIEGTNPELLAAHVEDIGKLMATEDVCRTLKSGRQYWILQLCESLSKLVPSAVALKAEEQIFTTLVSVFAMTQDGDTKGRAIVALSNLKVACGRKEIEDLFTQNGSRMLEEIKQSEVIWASTTPEKLIFATFLTQGGSAVEKHLDIILDILVSQLDPKKDPEVRLNLFTLLSEILSNYSGSMLSSGNQVPKLEVFIRTIVQDVLSPNLVWKAGKTASALRAAASSCLLTILEERLLGVESFVDVSGDLVTGCLGAIDDTYHLNRLLSTQCLGKIAESCDKRLSPELINKIYPELLKRLDDEKKDVRVCGAVGIARVFSSLPKDYDGKFFKAHLEYAMSVLLVHLDDEDEDVQEAVLEALKAVGRVSPDMLITKCNSFKSKHRSPINCDKLVDYLEGISLKEF